MFSFGSFLVFCQTEKRISTDSHEIAAFRKQKEAKAIIKETENWAKPRHWEGADEDWQRDSN